MSGTDSEPFRFTLYVTGGSGRAQFALENLQVLLDEVYPHHYELTVVDILDDPDAAEAQGILATPTLIKGDPPPERRVIGDFSNRAKVLSGLGLSLAEGAHRPDAHG